MNRVNRIRTDAQIPYEYFGVRFVGVSTQHNVY